LMVYDLICMMFYIKIYCLIVVFTVICSA
jgi:hypothetical protein